jgi:hypothetical protein
VVESPSLWHADDGYQGGQGAVAACDLPRHRTPMIRGDQLGCDQLGCQRLRRQTETSPADLRLAGRFARPN